MLLRAITNVFLGDGHFWKHPESKNYNLIWTSINKDWLEWKKEHLLGDHPGTIAMVRKANAPNAYANSKPLYQLKSYVHPKITQAKLEMTRADALRNCDMLDYAIWYIDDGCCVTRRDGRDKAFNGYRVSIGVGGLLADEIFPQAQEVFGTKKLGRVYKNNSRASERNLSWIIPKPVAIQILREARKIAPESLLYKTPVW
jgi:hypothetical protein